MGGTINGYQQGETNMKSNSLTDVLTPHVAMTGVHAHAADMADS
jgi:hypothetical protein